MNPAERPSFEPPADLDPVPARALLREVIAETAPDELDWLDGYDALDDQDFTKVLDRRSRREPLGIGLSELVALSTPVVWYVLQKAAEHAAETALDESIRKTGRWWQRRRKAPLELAPMPVVRIDAVREAILESASEAGLDEELAQHLADGVVKRLKTKAEEPDPESGSPDPDAAPED